MHIHFLVPPSEYEIDHAGLILSGFKQLESSHVLPDTPFWRSMEFRDRLNPGRFAHWHPNLNLILDIAAKYRDEHVVPHDCVPTAPVVCEPPPPILAAQSVPEPSTGHLLTIGLIIYAVKRVVFG